MSAFIPLLIVIAFICLVWQWPKIQEHWAKSKSLRIYWSAPPTNPEDDPDFMRWLNRKYKK